MVSQNHWTLVKWWEASRLRAGARNWWSVLTLPGIQLGALLFELNSLKTLCILPIFHMRQPVSAVNVWSLWPACLPEFFSSF